MDIYKRGKFFNFVKSIMKIFVMKPKYVFLGDSFSDNAIYLTNHIGAKVPIKLELYFPIEMRMWGTYEMNSTYKNRFIYLYKIYFHKKKHMWKWLSFIVAIFATPIMTCFYKGMHLISTYPDGRIFSSMKESLSVLYKDKKSVVIFPENSSDGYHDELKEFYCGFYSLASLCYEKGLDLPIYLMYFQRKTNICVVDKPVMFSTLLASGLDKNEIAENFKNRANELRFYKEK